MQTELWTINLKSFEIYVIATGEGVVFQMNYKLEKFWNILFLK